MAKEMAKGFTILSLLSADRGSASPRRGSNPHEIAIKWRKVVTAFHHFIQPETSMISVLTGLNSKMDKVAKTLNQGVFTRVSVALSSGGGAMSQPGCRVPPHLLLNNLSDEKARA